jgi:spatacsin
LYVTDIVLIEAQSPKTLKMLAVKICVESLWIFHCEHKVLQLGAAFKSEIAEKGKVSGKPLKCQNLIIKYYQQMNAHELETLLDIMCKEGLFPKFDKENLERFLVQTCENQM